MAYPDAPACLCVVPKCPTSWTFWADGEVTLLRSSERKRRFITGVETPACILTSHCPTSWTFWAGWRVTLLRSSKRNNTFFTGTPPFGLHPCLYSDVPTGLCVWATGVCLGGWVGDAPTEFCMENTFYTGTPPFGLHPCLYCIVPKGLFVCLVLQDILSCFTRHFGRRLGITNKFVLLSACSKIGRRKGIVQERMEIIFSCSHKGDSEQSLVLEEGAIGLGLSLQR